GREGIGTPHRSDALGDFDRDPCVEARDRAVLLHDVADFDGALPFALFDPRMHGGRINSWHSRNLAAWLQQPSVTVEDRRVRSPGPGPQRHTRGPGGVVPRVRSARVPRYQ